MAGRTLLTLAISGLALGVAAAAAHAAISISGTDSQGTVTYAFGGTGASDGGSINSPASSLSVDPITGSGAIVVNSNNPELGESGYLNIQGVSPTAPNLGFNALDYSGVVSGAKPGYTVASVFANVDPVVQVTSAESVASVDEQVTATYVKTLTIDGGSSGGSFNVAARGFAPSAAGLTYNSNGATVAVSADPISYSAFITVVNGGATTGPIDLTNSSFSQNFSLSPNSPATVTETLSALSGLNARATYNAGSTSPASQTVFFNNDVAFNNAPQLALLVTVLPEPATLPIAGLGLVALAGMAVRKRRRVAY